MTQEHTPGPWVISYRKDGSSYICMGGVKRGQQHKQFDLPLYRGDGNDEDDARLIAAAPDMLEALQQLVIEYDEVDLADIEPESFTAAVISARAAIARATGAA